ncbi:hypothetical protein Cadr_000002064 [Camelus dromedarius]|uniref:Uncharacterized protein n=1 Tax=Camelus dromedarius TaxID=9838 RepID=A0A5N4EGT3_CAMDR|nr:hypothetical protein Cadr_000002064 [Camelus dromedarius]
MSSTGHPFLSDTLLPPSPFHLHQESAESPPPPKPLLLPCKLPLLTPWCLSVTPHSPTCSRHPPGIKCFIGGHSGRERDSQLETTQVPVQSTVPG